MLKPTALLLSLSLALAVPAVHAGMLKKMIVVGGITMAGKAIAKKHAEKKQQDAQKSQNGKGQGQR